MKLNGFNAYHIGNGIIRLEDETGNELISGSFEEISSYLKFKDQKNEN